MVSGQDLKTRNRNDGAIVRADLDPLVLAVSGCAFIPGGIRPAVQHQLRSVRETTLGRQARGSRCHQVRGVDRLRRNHQAIQLRSEDAERRIGNVCREPADAPKILRFIPEYLVALIHVSADKLISVLGIAGIDEEMQIRPGCNIIGHTDVDRAILCVKIIRVMEILLPDVGRAEACERPYQVLHLPLADGVPPVADAIVAKFIDGEIHLAVRHLIIRSGTPDVQVHHVVSPCEELSLMPVHRVLFKVIPAPGGEAAEHHPHHIQVRNRRHLSLPWHGEIHAADPHHQVAVLHPGIQVAFGNQRVLRDPDNALVIRSVVSDQRVLREQVVPVGSRDADIFQAVHVFLGVLSVRTGIVAAALKLKRPVVAVGHGLKLHVPAVGSCRRRHLRLHADVNLTIRGVGKNIDHRLISAARPDGRQQGRIILIAGHLVERHPRRRLAEPLIHVERDDILRSGVLVVLQGDNQKLRAAVHIEVIDAVTDTVGVKASVLLDEGRERRIVIASVRSRVAAGSRQEVIIIVGVVLKVLLVRGRICMNSRRGSEHDHRRQHQGCGTFHPFPHYPVSFP